MKKRRVVKNRRDRRHRCSWLEILPDLSPFRSDDPGNSLQVSCDLDLSPAAKQFSNLFFRGKSDLADEPAARLERGVGLRNQPAIDVHAFLSGKDRDFGLELADLLLYFVGFGFADIRRIRNN